MQNIAYAEAATEVLAILKNTQKEAVNKIPKKFIDFLKKNSSKTYEPSFDSTKSIKELNLKPKTQALLGLIYLRYWADEEGKEKFNQKLNENEKKYQKELQEKYSVDNLFKNRTTVINQESKQEQEQEETQLTIVRNKTFIQKIIEKIISIVRR